MTSPRRRRALFLAVTAVMVLLVAEGVARLGFRWMTQDSYSRAEIRRQRHSLAFGTSSQQARAVVEQGRSRALHPFLGSVLDPAYEGELVFEGVHAVPGEDGFYRPTDGEAPAEGHTVVAVFGGSVATLASFTARQPLAASLEPQLGRPIAFRSRALGGFKQPQQLLALTYALSQGQRYEVVINLDGFNEVVLPMLFHRLDEVYPFYPRDWPVQVEGFADPATRLKLGRLALEQEQRRRRAEAFDLPVLGALAPWNLLWKALDRRGAGRIAKLQEELAGRESAGRPYRSHGPAWDYSNHREAVRALAKQWAAASLQMHRLCEANGIRYLHFLQPNQYVPGSKVFHPEEERREVTGRRRWGRFVKLGWPHLQAEGEALRELGVEFVDLTMLFADVEEPIYRDDCCHLNARGHEILAQAMVEALSQASP